MNVWVRRGLIAAAVVCVLAVVGGIASVGGVFWYYGRDLAALDEDGLKNYRPPQITRVYARDGELIGELFEERRTVIRYEEVPSHVENAFLAAEDSDFYRHEGMDYMGMVRALVANVRAGKVTQGASTITQQVVKTFVLTPERTFERKVQELILARRLEQAFTKAEILELYLNEIYLGHGRYGIQEASRFYFGQDVQDIDLGQAALLATLPKAPGRDSPIQNPEKAKARQIYVLGQMVKHGFATSQEAQRFIDAELTLADPADRPAPQSGAEEFVDLALARVREHYGDDALASLGAEVHTTVSLEAQRKTRDAVSQGLADIDKRNGYAHGLKPLGEDALAKAMAEAGQGALAVGRRVSVAVREGAEGTPADGFAAHAGDRPVFVRVPDGSRFDEAEVSLAEQFPVGALVSVEVIRPPDDARGGVPPGWAEARILAGPESAVVVADVSTGDILALVGGSHYALGDFNRATDAKRQPGSSFKPFVYGAALESRKFTAASLIDDSPEVYKDWKPTNYSRDRYLGPVRARVALAKSVNTIPVKLTDELGPDAVIAFASKLGITSEIPENLSIALGTGEVSPFEMARAYLTIARGGERIEPRTISHVVVGGVTETFDAEAKQVLEPEVAAVLTSMMRSVVTEGTARKAAKLGREVVGKTGTSNESKDAWFVGFSPDHVAITWVGFDSPKRIGRGETGGKAALPIWMATIKAVSPEQPRTFATPSTVVVRAIDKASGLLVPTGAAAADYKGASLEEVFVPGTEPVEEAVPAALPKGDVLLDLYDDAPPPAEDGGEVADDAVPDNVGGVGDPDGATPPQRDTSKLPPRQPTDEPAPSRGALPSL